MRNLGVINKDKEGPVYMKTILIQTINIMMYLMRFPAGNLHEIKRNLLKNCIGDFIEMEKLLFLGINLDGMSFLI